MCKLLMRTKLNIVQLAIRPATIFATKPTTIKRKPSIMLKRKTHQNGTTTCNQNIKICRFCQLCYGIGTVIFNIFVKMEKTNHNFIQLFRSSISSNMYFTVFICLD